KLGDLRRLVLQVGTIAGIVALLLVSAVLVAGGPALRLVMGPDFAEGAEIMAWVVAAAAVGGAGLPVEPLLVSVGAACSAPLTRAVTVAVYLAAALILVDRPGLVRAGVGILGGAGVVFASQFWAVLRWHRAKSGPDRPSRTAAAPGEGGP